MKTNKNFIGLLIFVLFSCSRESKELQSHNLYIHDEVDYNFLIYMAADNNLERFGVQNIKALQEVGSPKNTNIIVLFDRSGGYDRTEGNWSNTKLFLISNNPKNMNDDCIYDYEELDMTSSHTLYNFLEFTNKYFPAKHTILDLWSHGRGVYPDGIISRSVIEDYTTGYGSDYMMSVQNLAKCLKKFEDNNNKRIDILLFDACYMQMIEISYELRRFVDYIIGAESSVPGAGCNYKTIASFFNGNFTMEELATFLVRCVSQSSIDYSYSGIETVKLDEFITLFNSFCMELINIPDACYYEIIKKRKEMSKIAPVYPEFVDLYELISEIDVINVQNELLQKISELIIESNSIGIYKDITKGLGINFPYEKNEVNYYKTKNSDYEILDFYNDTYFDEFLLKIWSVCLQ